LFAIFTVMVFHAGWSWVFARFLHYERQNRSLDPQTYDVRVITTDDYRLLSDPTKRDVTLADGTRFQKAPVWETIVLPKYKAAGDGSHYVLVTTKGTAHVLPYLEGVLLLFGFFAACGSVASIWNVRLLHRESMRARESP
jgi:hypothetical protein